MERLRSRAVGRTRVLREAATPAQVDDKTPTANPEATMNHQREISQILAPGRTTPAGSIRRSVRITNRLNGSPTTLDNWTDVGPTSVSVTSNAEPGIVVDNLEGQECPSVNRDNAESSGRGRCNGSSRGRGRGRGKYKLSNTNADIQEGHTTGELNSVATGWGNRRGKYKRKLNDGTSLEVQFPDESDKKELESMDDESNEDLMPSKDGSNSNFDLNKHPVEDLRDEGIPSIAEFHVGDGILGFTLPIDPVSEIVQQNALEENYASEDQHQNHNDRVMEQNLMEENATLEHQKQNHTDRVIEQNVMEENAIPQNQNQNNNNNNNNNRVTARERFLAIARSRASHFAFFNPENDQPLTSQQTTQSNIGDKNDEARDWPGPFSTARRLVEERANALAARQAKLSGTGNSASLIKWEPTREKDFVPRIVHTSLYDMCLRVLCKHAECIESLEGIPDAVKNRICQAFCALRKVTPQVLRLFITGAQTEIRVPDCSLIPEEDLTTVMAQCSTANLQVLQLGMCGRGLTDRLLQATLGCPSVGLPCLTYLSLNGAYRLSDVGLRSLVQVAPLLSSVDLSRCSLLSEASIMTLADHLAPVIKELRLEECYQLEAFKIVPAIIKMQNLEVLSVAGIPSVTNDIVTEILAYLGCNLKELSLADCRELTDGALEAIGSVCCRLDVLNLDNLNHLTDTALIHLANGCRSLKTLSLKRCQFSDKAVAAFIGASGSNLSDLSLNGVKQVEYHTVLALLTNVCENLSRLDVSWCRKLTDEALGLLADSCPLLQELILFGCTQVTDKFLKGHSNSLLKVIGVSSFS